jgi:T-complex protein 1 subunit delta
LFFFFVFFCFFLFFFSIDEKTKKNKKKQKSISSQAAVLENIATANMSRSYAAAASKSTAPKSVNVAQQSALKGEKERDVRMANIAAAKAVADCVRTSLGPRGMDKMIQEGDGEVMITNDGRTLLEHMKVAHPAAKMLVELSKAQDDAVGDGTTSVVVLAGSLLASTQSLMERGIHPSTIAAAFKKTCAKAEEVLVDMALPVSLDDREALLKSAATSLSSKVVSQNAELLAPICVDAVLSVVERGANDASKQGSAAASSATATGAQVETSSDRVDLRNVRVVKNLGKTVDSSELVHGLVFAQPAAHTSGAPTRIADAKVALIQFQLSPPKPNIDHNVVISDYTQMDRVFREERKYILNIVRVIKKSGANVLLIQKSILRDAVNELALHYLAKLKIMVVSDIERNEIEYISRTLGCLPIASIEGFAASKLGSAELVEEESTSSGKIVRITGVPNPSQAVSILVRGSNQLTLDEAERSIHDALCVIRSIVHRQYLIAGGSAPEIELSLRLSEYAKTLHGKEAYCVRAFADALEIIPYTLAENAGLNPIAIVTELRNRHAQGERNAGINVRTVCFFFFFFFFFFSSSSFLLASGKQEAFTSLALTNLGNVNERF